MSEPTPREVFVNGTIWVVVLTVLATLIARVAVLDCLEQGSWCDTIERVSSHE